MMCACVFYVKEYESLLRQVRAGAPMHMPMHAAGVDSV